MTCKKLLSRSVGVCMVALTLLLSGCNYAEASIEVPIGSGYSIYEVNGQHYMKIDGDNYVPGKEDDPRFETLKPEFHRYESLPAMKDTVINGKLTEFAVRDAAEYFMRDEEGRIPICNFNKLFSSMQPEDMSVSGVYWRGAYYYFLMNPNTHGEKTALLSYISGELYEEVFKEYYTDFFTDKEYEYYFDEQTKEEVYTCTEQGSEYKYVRYTVEKGNKKLYVQEKYSVADNLGATAKDAVPVNVDMIGIDNGIGFMVQVSDFEERPAKEWLLKFGMEGFEGNPGHVYPWMKWMVAAVVFILAVAIIAVILLRRRKKTSQANS